MTVIIPNEYFLFFVAFCFLVMVYVSRKLYQVKLRVRDILLYNQVVNRTIDIYIAVSEKTEKKKQFSVSMTVGYVRSQGLYGIQQLLNGSLRMYGVSEMSPSFFVDNMRKLATFCQQPDNVRTLFAFYKEVYLCVVSEEVYDKFLFDKEGNFLQE